MTITKPPGIESDAFKSAKWDELTNDRTFAQADDAGSIPVARSIG